MKTNLLTETVFVASFPPDRRLCFTTYIRLYESFSSHISSYVKRHKPVSLSTSARWAESVLALAVIDTTIFNPHSTRSAASSAAFNARITLSIIPEAADWSNESNFKNEPDFMKEQ